MSTIIYGPQGCGKTRNAEALAKHLGLSNIVDDWMSGDELPEDTLALTGTENVPGALEFSDVMSEIAKERETARNDLHRDLHAWLSSEVRGPEFSLSMVKTGLRLMYVPKKLNGGLDEMIDEVLLSLGCAVLSRAYDKFERWYLKPVYEDPYEKILRPFVVDQDHAFNLEEAVAFIGLNDCSRMGTMVRIHKALASLGCSRIERDPGGYQSRIFYVPPHIY